MPSLLVALVVDSSIEVVRSEVVRQDEVTGSAGHLISLVIDGCTGIHDQSPVTPSLVDIGNDITIERSVGHVVQHVTSVVTCECGQCSRIVLGGLAICGLVQTCTCGNIQPFERNILERSIVHVTTLVHVTVIAVLHPVRVLDIVGTLGIWPVLCLDTCYRVPSFIEAHLIEIISSREEIKTRKRVEISTL